MSTPIAIILALLALALIGFLVYKARRVPLPRRRWKRFTAAQTEPLPGSAYLPLEGIYRVEEGIDFLGETAVARWSYTKQKDGTDHHLSFFFGSDGAHAVTSVRTEGSTRLIHGWWRKMSGSGTGTLELENSGDAWTGLLGNRNRRPRRPVKLVWTAPLPERPPFEIIGHRGGARNVDFAPFAENSLAALLMAARIGATGVEIDVRWTRDGVPVLAHDSFLAFDSVRTPLFAGFISNYRLRTLQRMRLRKGGRIPTLREALDAVLRRTPLELVWLDVKEDRPLEDLQALALEFTQKAKESGRKLDILIGIPDAGVAARVAALAGQKPTLLCEMDPEEALKAGANVWAPQYTGGPQPEVVARMQNAGLRVFLWSLDNPLMFRYYMGSSPFDGLVTNCVPVLAHWWYTEAPGVLSEGSPIVNRQS